MSKYAGLPDIDTAPDVFETADEPDIPLRPSEDILGDDDKPLKSTSENIDGSSLPARNKAEKKFGRGIRRADPSDQYFRPRLPPLRNGIYEADSSDDETTRPVPKESAAGRIRRLKAELAELEEEIANDGGSTFAQGEKDGADGYEAGPSTNTKRKSVLPPRQPVDLVGELGGLRERMVALEMRGDVGGASVSDSTDAWGERLARLTKTPSTSLGENGVDTDGTAPQREEMELGGPKLSELDRRLASLEDLVGPTEDNYDQTSSGPLITTLSKLDHLLSILTHPRHLDSISRRIKLLLVDLDRAAAASRKTGGISTSTSTEKPPVSITLNATEYTSLQSLFSLLPRLDPLLPILPPLLIRLQSLAGLHSEAGDVVDSLRKLQADEGRMGEEVKDLEGVVKSIQKGLEDSTISISKNWESLEGRIKDLDHRMSRLGNS